MAKDNSFKINLQVMFDKVKSLAIVQKGMKAIEAKLSKLKRSEERRVGKEGM